MTAFLKLGEEIDDFLNEHDQLKAKVCSLEAVASSLNLSNDEWKRKFEVTELRLAEEQRLKERMEKAGLAREGQFKQQVSLLEAKADQAKELLKNAEGKVVFAEARAEELAQRLAAERAEKEALQAEVERVQAEKETLKQEVDSFPLRIQTEHEDAESDISERFLYVMWLRHPEIDYSFMGPDAVEGIQRFEEEAKEEREAAARGEPSSIGNVTQLPQDVAPANQGANEALGDQEFEDLFTPFANVGGKNDGAI